MISTPGTFQTMFPKPISDIDRVEVDASTVKNYVCCQIFAGLGNQMFEYATGYALAKRLGVELILGVKASGKLKHTEFGLEIFPITARIWKIEKRNSAPKLVRLLTGQPKIYHLEKQWPGSYAKILKDAHPTKLQEIKSGALLESHLASEHGFIEYADEIRREFSLQYLVPELDPSLYQAIQDRPTVSVHIRRGDYVNNPANLANFKMLDSDYYDQARDIIKSKVPNSQFMIFSDDPTAAAELTKHWTDRIVVPAQDRAHDLALMSFCSHHIIANSTFSWWGAWLNSFADKIVVAPRTWYNNQNPEKSYHNEICPKNWHLT